ncbi:hypothetical protein HMPREF3159_03435 [Brachybacterium sp. HMSC06H03]|uniref:hypothetical protein n=1 Tax=Brachybacterium sp. HMSC06H03 TaxID=1581127 RepID=UPI0008A2DA67|nr:hypothetical protein [Brachybacterium sp. HMSC06H03]OFT62577.1 hypothetical protein HMPREF3159_03435 [Brachybacterium sp. HMSC06H03]
MTSWTRTDEHGITVTFTYTPDQRGNVTLTVQEVEGLMRAGGWREGAPLASPDLAPHLATIDAYTKKSAERWAGALELLAKGPDA